MLEQQTIVPTPMLLGPTVEHWQITLTGAELYIQRIREAHLPEHYHRFASLLVRAVKVADSALSLTVLDPAASIPSTTHLHISLQSSDALLGDYVQTSAGVMGLPPHQSSGSVTLRRVDLSLQSGAAGSLRHLPSNPLPLGWAHSFCMPECD